MGGDADPDGVLGGICAGINAAKRGKRLRKQQLCVVIDGRTSRAQLSSGQLSGFSGVERLFLKTTETDFKAATQEDVRSRMGFVLVC